MRAAVATGRALLAAAALAAVVVQLVIAVATGFGVVNFFSYFTILSNTFAAVVFVVGAVQLVRRVEPGSAMVALRGASVVYMAFVGVVFTTLLRDADLGGLLPWVNTVHHYVMPVAVVLDWLFCPPGRPISVRTVGAYLVFPAVYTAYSLVRGALTGFYPYPFFDPARAGGYGPVALYCAGMLVVFLGIAFLVRWTGKPRGR
jgi:hypothetical protein